MKNRLSKTVLSFFSDLCFHVMLCYCKGDSSDTNRDMSLKFGTFVEDILL